MRTLLHVATADDTALVGWRPALRREEWTVAAGLCCGQRPSAMANSAGLAGHGLYGDVFNRRPSVRAIAAGGGFDARALNLRLRLLQWESTTSRLNHTNRRTRRARMACEDTCKQAFNPTGGN